jgi:hypothetical protein
MYLVKTGAPPGGEHLQLLLSIRLKDHYKVTAFVESYTDICSLQLCALQLYTTTQLSDANLS